MTNTGTAVVASCSSTVTWRCMPAGGQGRRMAGQEAGCAKEWRHRSRCFPAAGTKQAGAHNLPQPSSAGSRRCLAEASGLRACRADTTGCQLARLLTPLQQLLQAAVEVLGAGRLQPHVCMGGGSRGGLGLGNRAPRARNRGWRAAWVRPVDPASPARAADCLPGRVSRQGAAGLGWCLTAKRRCGLPLTAARASPTGSSWQHSVRLTSASTAADSSAMRVLMAEKSWLRRRGVAGRRAGRGIVFPAALKMRAGQSLNAALARAV